jgi:hypothetical protein
MNDETSIRKKAILVCLLLLALFIGQYLLTHSILIVQSDSPNETIINVRTGEKAQDFTLTDSSKILLLSSGDYVVEAAEGDKQSLYQVNLGVFWVHKIDVVLSDQKNAISLGDSRLSCAIDQDEQKRAIHYPCLPSNNDTILASKDGVNFTKPFINPSLPYDEESYEQPIKQNISILPYGDGLLKAKLDDVLTIKSLGLETSKTIEIPLFNGSMDDNYFDTSTGDNESFAIFDNSNDTLFLYKNFNSGSPKRIKLAGEIVQNDDMQVKILIGDQYVYVLNTRSLGSIEGDPENKELEKPPNIDQNIFVIDPATEEIIAKHELADDVFIRDVSVSPSGNLLYMPLSEESGEVYVGSGKEAPKLKVSFNDTVGSICWKDDSSFYYSADSNSSIFLYSTDSKSSTLEYNNSESSIYNLRCSDSGKLYFSLTSPDDEYGDIVQHFMLSERPQLGVRLDSLFPLYVGSDANLARASMFRGEVFVKALSGSPPKTLTKQQIIDELNEEDVKTDDLVFNFLY